MEHSTDHAPSMFSTDPFIRWPCRSRVRRCTFEPFLILLSNESGLSIPATSCVKPYESFCIAIMRARGMQTRTALGKRRSSAREALFQNPKGFNLRGKGCGTWIAPYSLV